MISTVFFFCFISVCIDARKLLLLCHVFFICLQEKWEVEHGKIDPFFTLKKIAADEDFFFYLH